MTETTETPNPLKQARREKREAKAIKRFLRDYRNTYHGHLTDEGNKAIRDMIAMANVRIEATSDALALLQAGEVTK